MSWLWRLLAVLGIQRGYCGGCGELDCAACQIGLW